MKQASIRRIPLLAFAAAATVATSASWAETATATLNVSAQLVAACSMSVSGNLTFPQLTFQSPITTETPPVTVSVTCSNGVTTPVVTNNGGQNPGGGASFYRLKGPGASDFIPYMLYVGSAPLAPAASFASSPTTDGIQKDYSVKAQLNSTIFSSWTPGTYSDTVTLTVTYSI